MYRLLSSRVSYSMWQPLWLICRLCGASLGASQQQKPSGGCQLGNDPISRATHTDMLTASLPEWGTASQDKVFGLGIKAAAESVRGHVSGGPHGFDLNCEPKP